MGDAEGEVKGRDIQNKLKDLKIIAAIMLGKQRNKELAQVLDTDKSFTSKKVKALEEQGLVVKSGEGKDTRYEINEFNVLRFLQTKVVIKVGKDKKMEDKDERETIRDSDV
jgi:DNA-binding transcriptional ArsR family regulator